MPQKEWVAPEAAGAVLASQAVQSWRLKKTRFA
jgi:hypothetical protein